MIYIPELEVITRLYENLDMQPILVQAHLKLGSAVAAYHPPPYLDNLLARAVLDRATDGDRIPDSNDGYWISLPVKLFWQSPEGLPLWDSSVFMPITDPILDTVYTHKRPPKAIFSDAKSIKPSVGRWMERRLPLPISIAPVWEARCIGNADVILDLLKDIAFLGKRRSIGMGEVIEWSVAPGCFDTALTINGQLSHAVPVACGIKCDGQPVRIGWTPPQWKTSLHSLGWPVGASRTTDWYIESI